MSCPYFRESYFAVCVVPNAIHVPSIDEMERLCFRSWYLTCPNITRLKNSEDNRQSFAPRDPRKLNTEQLARPQFAAGKDREHR
jgi:hypothetical protein